MVALDILPMLEEEAKERQGVRNDIATTSVNFLTEVVAEPQRATAQAAAITGTNRQYVSDAKRISTEAPNLAVLQSRTAKNKKRHPAQSPGVFAFLWGWVLA